MTRLLTLLLLPVAVSFAEAQSYTIHRFKKIQLTDQFFSEGAYFGDFNRDGQMDIVSGPYWYEGPSFQQRHEYYPAQPFDPHAYSKNFLAYTHDLNGDGWTDILILGFPGEDASWYENPKGKPGYWPRHKVLEPLDNESPTWVDLTGDGKPEIVCNSGGYFGFASPDWSDPSKPWTFRPISPKGPWQRFTHGLGVGDVNGDGRLDILEAAGWWEQPASLDGDPVWKKHEVSFGTGGAQMFAYDVDGDGDNDVITSLAAHGYGLAWFEQTRAGGRIEFTQRTIINKEPSENKYGVKFSQLHAVDLVDMDGDGLKDILTGKRWWAHGPAHDPEPGNPAVLYWFKLVRGPKAGEVQFIPHLVDDNSGIGTQVAAGRINGDAYPDIVVGNKKGTFVFLNEARSATRQEWESSLPKPFSATAGSAP